MSAGHTHDAAGLLAQLLGPPGPELTCEECFEQLDRYVEAELVGDAGTAVSGMRAHLDGCPACQDDYESLRALLNRAGGRSQPGLPGQRQGD